MIDEIKQEWYEIVTKSMVSEAISILLGLDEQKLAEIVKDTYQPMMLRIIARSMLERDGMSVIEKLLNRTQWMPTRMELVAVNESPFDLSNMLKRIQGLPTDELVKAIHKP